MSDMGVLASSERPTEPSHQVVAVWLWQLTVKKLTEQAQTCHSLAAIEEDGFYLLLDASCVDGSLKAGKDRHHGGVKYLLLPVCKAFNRTLRCLHLPPALKSVLPFKLWLRLLSASFLLLAGVLFNDEEWTFLLFGGVFEQIGSRHLKLGQELCLLNNLLEYAL